MKKTPTELKSMINPLYYDDAIKDIKKFKEDVLNFGESNMYWTNT